MGSGNWYFYISCVDDSGGNNWSRLFGNNLATDEGNNYRPLRPIVTLKSGIKASSGNGSSGSPWKVN